MIDSIAKVLCRGQLMEPEVENNRTNWGPSVRAVNKNSYTTDNEMRFAKVRLLGNGRDDRNHTMDMPNCGGTDIEQNSVMGSFPATLNEDIRAIRDIMEKIQDKKSKQEAKEKCLREWKVICCVTDRLFFLSYLLINIVGIVVIFYGQVV